MKNLQIQYVSPSLLFENPHNVRLHPLDQIRKLRKSIQKFGFLNPILVDQKNRIICGHARLKAALELQLKTVPVIYSESLTEKETKQFMLIDNRLSELSEWNFEKFKIEIEDFDFEKDFEYFGFDHENFQVDGSSFSVNNDSSLFSSKDQSSSSSSSSSSSNNSKKYKEDHNSDEFLLVITCQSEQEQQKTYEKLISENYEVKII